MCNWGCQSYRKHYAQMQADTALPAGGALFPALFDAGCLSCITS
jgi:hypothetical protein